MGALRLVAVVVSGAWLLAQTTPTHAAPCSVRAQRKAAVSNVATLQAVANAETRAIRNDLKTKDAIQLIIRLTRTVQSVRSFTAGDQDAVLLSASGPIARQLQSVWGEPLAIFSSNLISGVSACVYAFDGGVGAGRCARGLSLQTLNAVTDLLAAASLEYHTKTLNKTSVMADLLRLYIRQDFQLGKVATKLGVPNDLGAIVQELARLDGFEFALFPGDLAGDLPTVAQVTLFASEQLLALDEISVLIAQGTCGVASPTPSASPSPTTTDVPTSTPSATATPLPTQPLGPAWQMFGRDAQRTSSTTVQGAQSNTVRWVFTTGGAVRHSLVVGTTGTVYVSSAGVTHAIGQSGSELWQVGVEGDKVLGFDDTVYIAVGGTVQAFRADGQAKWVYSPNPAIASITSLLIDERGMLYCSSSQAPGVGTMLAVRDDGASASEVWRTGTRQLGVAALGMDGRIYVHTHPITGVYPAAFWAFDRDTGVATWLGDNLHAPVGPAIGPDGTAYFGEGGFSGIVFIGTYWALRSDGTTKWMEPNTAVVGGSSALKNGLLFHGNYNALVARSQDDGTETWRFSLNNDGSNWYERGPRPSVDGNGSIYVGSSLGIVHALNADGTEKWRYQTGGAVHTQPAIGWDGTIYVGSDDANVYAFGP